MIVDSHALLWWLEGSPKLSKTAAGVFVDAEQAVFQLRVNSVTFWEFRRKELIGELETRVPVRQWPRILAQLPWIEIIGMDSGLWLKMAELDWAHRDPADRIIAASALRYGTPVLTKDRKFHASDSPVKAIW